ncbi:MAG: PcfB family protein [Lachnospiraceae bacterium]|nr:PcfB family protein [Lachnospiraceae bacterium]
MQDEVGNKTVNLAVSSTKTTARTLIRAIRWYLLHHNQKKIREEMHKNFKEGKQSVKDLLKAGVSTDKIELPDGSARRFCKTAKKLGVDYAIRKDKTSKPTRYMVFFKAKDTEVLSQVIKEFEAKNNEKQKKQSVREQLRAEKQKAKEKKAKSKTKAKKVKKRKERMTGR